MSVTILFPVEIDLSFEFQHDLYRKYCVTDMPKTLQTQKIKRVSETGRKVIRENRRYFLVG